MSKATLTIEGFAAKDPEIGDHQGKAFTNVTVPHTPRRKNRQTGDWEDAGPTLWVQASFWEDEAHAVARAVRKGTLVTITGQPELNVYQRQDGTADAQVRLRFATLGVIPRAQGPSGGGNQSQGVPVQGGAVQEPWATAQPGGGFGDETPF